MGTESALREQRLEHITEDDNQQIPSDADFLPFADILDDVDWSPDINLDQRRGVGSLDQQKFDRGTETHSFTVGYDLQGAIALATGGSPYTVNAPPVYEAIVRKASNQLNRRTVVWREYHPGAGAAGAGQHLFAVARHCAPDTLTLSGDPEAGSPVAISLEYMAPKARTYTLNQPGSPDTIDVSSTVSESGDVLIRGSSSGVDTRETISLAAGSGSGTTTFEEIYAIEILGDFAGDLSFTMATSGVEVFLAYGSETYQGVEGDKGVPVLPASGERVVDHGGTEQRFIGNQVQFAGQTIAERVNGVELEVANNVESQAVNDKLGQVIEAGPRDITITSTVFGKSTSHQAIDRHLRKLIGDITWSMDLNTITASNATVTDPEGRQRSDGDVFAVKDVEWTSKSISVS